MGEYGYEGEHWSEEESLGEPVRRGRRALRVTVAVVVVGMLSVGGYGAYNLTHAIMSGSKGTSPLAAAPAPSVTTPPSAEQAAGAAKQFLDAWGRGDMAAAAALTDRQELAGRALSSFQQGLKAKETAFTATGPVPSPGQGTAGVGFHARLRFDGTDQAWEYDGVLGLVRTPDGRTAVHWTSKVLHPKLDEDATIAVAPVPAPAGRLVDRNGKDFDGSSAVKSLLAGVKSGDAGTGELPGRAVVLTRPGRPDEPMFVLGEPTGAQLKVTLDAELQQAAEAALAAQTSDGRAGSLVAVEPSSGRILAVASAPAGFNQAFGATIAPGSTMKVVTAAALLEKGLTPDSPAPCPDTVSSPRQWHNDERGDHPGYTLADDFAQSCNTAFIQQGLAKLTPGTLAQVALEQFGLGLEWHTGLPAFDAKIPTPADTDDQAAEYIGQGSIRANTLAMASVAATVQSGGFRQPFLVEGTDRATATGRLPEEVARSLRTMMAKAAAEGTAAKPMAGLGGQVGAKTGTAEVDGQKSNSWFIAYRGDLAVAVEVTGAGYGADAAGQAAAQVLKLGNDG
ncbi:penicillin-binding transpeptidase domain-containing protein [Kitasatospora sp. NPDC002227]|uniref:penicillin-binding transpeptidase domain-containing protein n=1 Tax=Kitasatospora sp. NPDC002227 TaxID=3154773 RepID=UPI00332F95B1